MNREEAIYYLGKVEYLDANEKTAIDMAIEALTADAVSREVYDERTQADEEIIDSYRQEFQKALSAEQSECVRIEVYRDLYEKYQDLKHKSADAVSLTETMKYLTKPHSYCKVVRCKDCRHYESDGGAFMVCSITDMVTDDDDFCSYGERREK